MFIVHPFAASLSGLAFLAFLASIFAHRLAFLFPTILGINSSLVSFVMVILDFYVFGHSKTTVSDYNNRETFVNLATKTSYDIGIWLEFIAFILLLFAFIASMLSFCAISSKRERTPKTAYA